MPPTERPPFFDDLQDKLSQGDIVRDVPWGVVDDPVTVCRPDEKGLRPDAQQRTARYGTRDAFQKAFSARETIHVRAESDLGMVLWPDCQVDKFANQGRDERKWFAGVAPLLPLATLPEALREGVRTARRVAYFPVPAYAELDIPEGYIDIRHIWPVKQSLLQERVIGISTSAKLALVDHVFSFLTETRFRDSVTCTCGRQLKREDLLAAAEDEA